MDSLDRETLSQLAEHVGWPSVTIHMPTHRVGTDKEQDRIRLKNLMRDAEDQLSAGGLRNPEIDAIMRPIHELLGNPAFWREMSDGLAVFLARDFVRTFKLDESLPEHVSVGDRFAIRPVLPALGEGESFYVLTLSKNRVRLLKGSRETLEDVDVSGIPESLAEVLKFDDYERHVQFHSRTPAGAAGRGRRAAVFHGHGGAPETAKDDLERYFRSVDRGLQDLLPVDHVPLLLAGVDYLLAMYRETNSYPHLIDATLSGNPDETPLHELHARARELLTPYFRSTLQHDIEAFEGLSGTDSTSNDLAQIVPAAHEGRVRVLFVTPESAGWGRYDPASGNVEFSEKPGPGDWDLAELAAAETILHGGTVHALEAEDAPVATAAIFRY